ncbi:RxLR effector protein [Phytophthora megakarya]|uniref:RxLR effector protein n=1 Tax=Phytophthora megakarya TaxID=4795 RepID=A0A225X1D8_9STRA|nr:RxLR effector protein [Phytophthora megakarya]
MRYISIVLVVAEILLSGVTSAIVMPGMSQLKARSIEREQQIVLAKRMLRSQTAPNKNEERTIGTSFTKVAEQLKAGTSKAADSAKLKGWLLINKPVDKALDALKLNTGVDNAILNPKLKLLDNYVNMFNEKHPKKQITLAGALISRYGDEALVNALVTARQAENSRNIAIKLQKQQMEGWLNSQLSIGNVLDKLKLNTGVEEAILHPNLKILDNYVNMFRKKNPEQHVSLVGALTSRYGDEPLANALVTARQADNSNTFLKRLQAEQLADWGSNQMPVNEVFSLLKVKDDDIRALISPKLVTLNKYIKLFNLRQNRLERTDLFKVLRAGFGENEFAILVSRAMDDPLMAAVASKYQRVEFKRWIRYDYDPIKVLNDVFKKDNLAAATTREQSILDTYRPIYYKAKRLDNVDIDVAPRRS